MSDDWKVVELVAPCGGSAFSPCANALSVSAPIAVCRAGVLGGYGLRGAGVWASLVHSGVIAARLYLSPLPVGLG